VPFKELAVAYILSNLVKFVNSKDSFCPLAPTKLMIDQIFFGDYFTSWYSTSAFLFSSSHFIPEPILEIVFIQPTAHRKIVTRQITTCFENLYLKNHFISEYH